MVDNNNSETNNLGRNRIEDVQWLCSLSETELDMLIWMKRMVLHRAQRIGHKSLAREFDLKTLRLLSLTMMEHLTDQLKGLSVHSRFFAEVRRHLDESNLLRSAISGYFSSMSSEQLWAYICPEKKKRLAKLFTDDRAPRQKQRTMNGDSSRVRTWFFYMVYLKPV